MERKSIYTTVDERRKAQARRDEQIKLNEERHKLKNGIRPKGLGRHKSSGFSGLGFPQPESENSLIG